MVDLRPDPFARKPVEPLLQRGAGREPVGVEPAGGVAVPGVDAEEAQDAQVVLRDPRRRVAHEPHAAGPEVGEAAERIDHGAVRAAVERVHGEVAPGGVLGEVVGEGDGGAPPVGRHVAAEGGDLEGPALRRSP